MGLAVCADPNDLARDPYNLSLEAGWSRLLFRERPQPTGPYHFAFNISPAKLTAAKSWLRRRGVTLLERDGQDQFDFPDWNAQAVYFFDPDGNIVEFIARHNLGGGGGYPGLSGPADFSTEDILCLSEIGLPWPDPGELAQLLQAQGLPVWRRVGESFQAVGDEHGLCVVVAQARPWFPTDQPSQLAPLLVRMEGDASSFELGNYRFQFTTGWRLMGPGPRADQIAELGAFHALVETGQTDAAAAFLEGWLDEGPETFEEDDRSAFRALLFHPHDHLRQQAARACGQARDVSAIPLLVKLHTRALDYFDNDFVWDAFQDMGDAAVAVLTKIMREGDEDERQAAMWGLGHARGEAVPVLVEAARQGVPRAALSLGNSCDPGAVPALLDLLGRGGGESSDAAYSLARCCDASCGYAVSDILRLYPTQPEEVQIHLWQALGKIGDVRAAPILARGLRQRGWEAESIRYLRDMGAPEAVIPLLGALGSPRYSRARQTQLVAAILGHPGATSQQRRHAAQYAISSFAKNPDACEALFDLVDDPDCRDVVLEAGRSHDPMERLAAAVATRSTADFRLLARHHSPTVRRRCVEYCWDFPGLTQDDFQLLAHDPDPGVRVQLARVAYQGGLVPGRPLDPWPIAQMLLRDAAAAVRAQAAANLNMFGTEALSAAELLAADRSPRVRQVAARALAQLSYGTDPGQWAREMRRFLYDPRGRTVDPLIGHEETLSDRLTRADTPEADRLVSAWKLAGGRRGHPPSPRYWSFFSRASRRPRGA